MSLERIEQLMKAAQSGQYAVGYFESWNLDSLQGVIDAAEKTRSPVIIGFNGEFLSQRAGATTDELAAAKYIASQLKLLKIKPAGDDGGYEFSGRF